jgi:hypothetical protein
MNVECRALVEGKAGLPSPPPEVTLLDSSRPEAVAPMSSRLDRRHKIPGDARCTACLAVTHL